MRKPGSAETPSEYWNWWLSAVRSWTRYTFFSPIARHLNAVRTCLSAGEAGTVRNRRVRDRGHGDGDGPPSTRPSHWAGREERRLYGTGQLTATIRRGYYV